MAAPPSADLVQAKLPSLSRSNVTACIRCRRRKKRCDKKLPSCRLCEAAGVECVGYDALAQKQVSRSYLYDLENEVTRLRTAIQQVAPEAQATDWEASNNDSPTAPEGSLLGESQRPRTDNRLERADKESSLSLSGVLLDTTVRLDCVRSPRITSGTDLPGDGLLAGLNIRQGFNPPSGQLPTRAVADYLVKLYFEFANFHLPLLNEPTLRHNLELVYADSSPVWSTPGSAGPYGSLAITMFFVNMVFALALLTLQKHGPSKFPAQLCGQYYEAALKYLKTTTIPETTEGVQALSLLAQYAYLHPLHSGGWNMAGAALRHAVGLRLHEDPVGGEMDSLAVDTRRRTFWVAYSMDRNIAVATGRPQFLSDGAITAKYPAFVDDEFITASGIVPPEPNKTSPKTYSFHWFQYRALQSEMCTVLREKPPTAWHMIEYGCWQKSMRDQIQEWYDQVCQESQPCIDAKGENPGPRFELTYQRALFLLYRPCRSIPFPDMPARLELVAAASKVITLYRQFYDENRIHLFWQAAENIYDAGSALMSSYIQFDDVRQKFNVRELEELTHLSSNMLWALAERFPAVSEKRDAFDRARASTLANLSNQFTAKNVSGAPASLSCVQGETGHHVETSNNNSGLECQMRSRESNAHNASVYNAPTGEVRLPSDCGDVHQSTTDSLLTDNLEPFWDEDSMQQSLDWTNFDENMELNALAWHWE